MKLTLLLQLSEYNFRSDLTSHWTNQFQQLAHFRLQVEINNNNRKSRCSLSSVPAQERSPYLCALRGQTLAPEFSVCTHKIAVKKKIILQKQNKGGNVSLVQSKRIARRGDSVVARPQPTSRGKKAACETKSPWRTRGPGTQRVLLRKTWALLTVGRQGASRWMQRPICLKHTHRAGSGEPSRPSASQAASRGGGETWFTGALHRVGCHRSGLGRRMDPAHPYSTLNVYCCRFFYSCSHL